MFLHDCTVCFVSCFFSQTCFRVSITKLTTYNAVRDTQDPLFSTSLSSATALRTSSTASLEDTTSCSGLLRCHLRPRYSISLNKDHSRTTNTTTSNGRPNQLFPFWNVVA